ncbi:hypothetical protein D3C76_1190160 [compost metagenome]
MATLLADGEFGLPQVVAGKLHRQAMPAPAVGLAPVEHHHQGVMAIGIDLAADLHRLAHHRLDRKQPAIEHRQGVLDHDPRFEQGLGQAQGLVRVVVCRGHAVGFEGLIAGHRTLLRYEVALKVQSGGAARGSKKMSDWPRPGSKPRADTANTAERVVSNRWQASSHKVLRALKGSAAPVGAGLPAIAAPRTQRLISSSMLISRILNFCTLPVTVIGNSSTKRK